jgi:predicted PurR-regulated permease PerM
MNEQKQWNLTLRYAAALLVFILGLIILWRVRSITEPLIVAAFVAYLLSPVVSYIDQHTRIKRVVVANMVYWILLAAIIALPVALTPVFFEGLKRVVSDALDILDQIALWLATPNLIPGIPFDFSTLADQLITFRSTFLTTIPEQAPKLLENASLGALWIVVIVVTGFYFLTEWPRLRNGMISFFPESFQPEVNELYKRIRSVWMNYLRGQLLLMVIVGVVFTIAWFIIGIPGALVLELSRAF